MHGAQRKVEGKNAVYSGKACRINRDIIFTSLILKDAGILTWRLLLRKAALPPLPPVKLLNQVRDRIRYRHYSHRWMAEEFFKRSAFGY